MTQTELELGDMVDTPLGRKSMATIVMALQQMYDPNTTIASLWSIEDVKSRRESLTDEQCMQVLHRVDDRRDAEIGINWDVIDFHIDGLFGGEE
jgi:hypothetical protein